MQTTSPNSSPSTAKMKSAWASGRVSLTAPSPGPLADQAALLEGLERPPDLVAVPAAAEQEAIDPVRDVAEAEIGQDAAGAGGQNEARQHRKGHAGQSELPEPDRNDHEGHADIGLQQQRAGACRPAARPQSRARASPPRCGNAQTARRTRRPCPGFRNSDGCMLMKPSESQRCAPLFSSPTNAAASVRSRAPAHNQARGLEHLDRVQQCTAGHDADGDRQENGVLEQEVETVVAVQLGNGRPLRLQSG